MDLGDRLPEFIRNTSRDHAAAGQGEVDAFEGLAIEDLERFAGLERPELTVLQAHVDAFRGREVVAPGRQFLEFVASTGIRRDETAFRELSTAGTDIGHDADLRLSEGLAAISCDHTAANRRSTEFGLLIVARGRLARVGDYATKEARVAR